MVRFQTIYWSSCLSCVLYFPLGLCGSNLRLLSNGAKQMDLMDLICFVQGRLDADVPPAWFAFGADVVEAYGNRQMFVEHTDSAALLK